MKESHLVDAMMQNARSARSFATAEWRGRSFVRYPKVPVAYRDTTWLPTLHRLGAGFGLRSGSP
jgi:hypothetical protein